MEKKLKFAFLMLHPNSYLVINKFIVLADISKSKKEKEKSNYLK